MSGVQRATARGALTAGRGFAEVGGARARRKGFPFRGATSRGGRGRDADAAARFGASSCALFSHARPNAKRCAAFRRPADVRARSPRCAAKKDIHPEWHDESKVICNGEEVFTVSGTKKEYVVDVWSGNHPFYLSGSSGGAMILDDERITKFNKKFEGMDDLFGGASSDGK